MNRTFPLSWYSLCALCALCGESSGAPPTVNYLYPAGGQRGTTVEVTAAGTFERWPVQGRAEVKGVEVKAAKDKGKLTVTVASDVEPGVAWLRLTDEQGSSSARPFVVGTLPEVLEKEPNDEPTRAQELTGSAVVNGKLAKPGDVDGFAITLRKGQSLVASMAANRALGSPMDAHLQVVSPAGFVLEESNDYNGLDPQVVLTAPADGRYVVRTFAFPATPDSGIRFAGADTFVYRLTVTTGGFVDHPWPLAVARSAPGRVELVGWNLPDAARSLPVPEGAERETVSLWHPELANTAAVRLEPHAVAVEREPNGPDKPQPVTLSATVSGRIDSAGDVDVYAFQAKKGQALTFRLESAALGFPLDGVLGLTDAAGKVLAKADDAGPNRDPELSFTATTDGPHRIEVRDLHGHGGPRYVYRLRAGTPAPDFDITVAADNLVVPPGKTLDVAVTVTRRGGFAGEVIVTAEGLPEGVTVEPITTAGSAASSGGRSGRRSGGSAGPSATLKLSAKAGPLSVPIRIVGRVKGQDSVTKAARHAPAGLDASTTWLWLTVPAK